MEFQLGTTVKDKITGLTGTLTGFATYITGCNQFLVQPQVKDGAFVDGKWMDAGRLESIKTGKQITREDVKGETNGCDISAPTK